jgi:hypothetical protein
MQQQVERMVKHCHKASQHVLGWYPPTHVFLQRSAFPLEFGQHSAHIGPLLTNQHNTYRPATGSNIKTIKHACQPVRHAGPAAFPEQPMDVTPVDMTHEPQKNSCQPFTDITEMGEQNHGKLL